MKMGSGAAAFEPKQPNILDNFDPIAVTKDDAYDFITSMAAECGGAAISFISLIAADKQRLLACHGLQAGDVPEDFASAMHGNAAANEPIVIEDVRSDQRYQQKPLIIGGQPVAFYAGFPLLDDNNRLLGTLCVVNDSPKKLNNAQINQLHKLARQATKLLESSNKSIEIEVLKAALVKKNELLEETQKANNLGIWEMNITSGETVWSDAVYAIHEVPRDFDHNQIKGIEFYHPDSRPIITEAIATCISSGKPFDVVCQMITAKDKLIWVRSTGRKVGEALIGSFQDITEIKRNELKFKGIFNSTFTFIGFLNTEGILLEANDTAVNMAGLRHADVIGKYFWDCYWWQISPRTRKELMVNFQRALAGETMEYEVAVWIANQTPLTILFSLKPLFDDDGRVMCVIPEGRPVQDIIEARRKYKSVIEGTNVGTWEWNVQTGETVFNERWAEIVGYTLAELAPINIETWMKLAHPDGLIESERRLQACFERKNAYYELETRMKHKDGHWVWVYDRGMVFEWTESGKPLMMYGTHQDITERKQKEEILRISEETFRGNFENGAVGMALLDATGKWIKVNAKLCQIVGYDQEELLQLTFQEITYPEDLQTDVELLQELVEGKRDNYQMEKRYYHKNGDIIYILLGVSMVKDEKGEVLYFIAQIVDISKRKRIEVELQQLLVEKQALMDATTEVALLSTTTDGKILNTNTGTKKILGYDNEELTNKVIQDLLFLEKEWKAVAQELLNSQPAAAGEPELIYALSNDTKHRAREWSFKRKDEKVIPVLLSVTEIILENASQGYLFAATDISHLKSIQEQLAQKNSELEQFAYIAAHDLKEPLRGITTSLSLLQKKYSTALEEKARSYIENAYNSAAKMKKLIDDILDFSRTGIVGHEEVDLDKLVDSIIKSYRNNHKIKFFKSALPIIKGDTSSFIQLFTNLIDNGIKYQPPDSVAAIAISVAEDEQYWTFSIADNGIGIEPQYQERVFEIFKRLHTYSEYKGTGIGLASCKKIVSVHGGKIWFEKNEPKGTVFKFTILK